MASVHVNRSPRTGYLVVELFGLRPDKYWIFFRVAKEWVCHILYDGRAADSEFHDRFEVCCLSKGTNPSSVEGHKEVMVVSDSGQFPICCAKRGKKGTQVEIKGFEFELEPAVEPALVTTSA